MNNEKIAFLCPIHGMERDGLKSSNMSPLLVLDCEEFPSITDVNFAVFFVGLSHNQSYYLKLSMYVDEGKVLKSIADEVGTHLRVKDILNNEDDIAASINLTFRNIQIEKVGNYLVEAELIKDGLKVDSNRAFFRVSEAY